MSRKTPGEVRARTCGTKSPCRSEALRFIDSSKSPSTKIDGSLVNFRRRLSNRHGRPRRMLIWTFEGNTDHCEHVNVIRTSRVLSPDRTWPDRWLSEMHESRKVGLGTTSGYDMHFSCISLSQRSGQVLSGLRTRLVRITLTCSQSDRCFLRMSISTSSVVSRVDWKAYA